MNYQYSITEEGILLRESEDSSIFEFFNKETGKWEENEDATFGEYLDSRPISEKEADKLAKKWLSDKIQ